jgi:hypothetical protein
MNAILLLSAPQQHPGRTNWTVSPVGDSDMDGADFAKLGAAKGPETLLTIEFVGLNAAEQARALASFPGAKRCVVASAR